MLVLEMFLGRISLFAQICLCFAPHTQAHRCVRRKQPLSSMQGDGGKGSYISHLDFLRIQTWMAWPVGKAPVLMSRAHVLPQVVVHLFPLFPLEQKKSIRNTSLLGLSAPRDEREGRSWTCERSNGI